jgi:hypothetical protein
VIEAPVAIWELGYLFSRLLSNLLAWGTSHLGTIMNQPCSMYAPRAKDTQSRRSQLPSPQTDQQALGLIEAVRISIAPVKMGVRISKKEKLSKIDLLFHGPQRGAKDVQAPLAKELAATPGSTEGGTTSDKSLLQLRPAVCVGIERINPN